MARLRYPGSVRVVVVLVILAACAKGTSFSRDAAPSGDGPTGDGDDEDADPAADAPGGTTAALFVTEVMLAPTTGEFIEIANPNDVVIDLSSYYLADSGNYFRVPATATVDATDFIVKFAPGTTIGAKAVITVAIDTAANFQALHGMAPTYSIASGTMTSVVANGTAQLTNGGELITLFYWDGERDLIRDVDLVLAGQPTAGNGLVDKSAVALDGPDTDSTTSTYSTDARTMTIQTNPVPSGMSTKRIANETGNEMQNGSGNGLTGDDETSETTSATWDTTFSTPTPGAVPTAVLM